MFVYKGGCGDFFFARLIILIGRNASINWFTRQMPTMVKEPKLEARNSIHMPHVEDRNPVTDSKPRIQPRYFDMGCSCPNGFLNFQTKHSLHVCRFLREQESSLLRDKCPTVQFLSCVIIAHILLYKRDYQSLSRVAVPFYIPNSDVQENFNKLILKMDLEKYKLRVQVSIVAQWRKLSFVMPTSHVKVPV